ncbi:hypothetical protein F7725_020060 [Dissostichus mawsoni]|uniref:Uncharacterized protein n=1 Tax=Dissostichus mawsoni TaxID=36200 RepID=A0A7J5YN27_DISMA|nr:hypothetical protein F7725_020060 [Dissostichus mawsoni]
MRNGLDPSGTLPEAAVWICITFAAGNDVKKDKPLEPYRNDQQTLDFSWFCSPSGSSSALFLLPQNNQLLITMKIVVVLSVLLCSAFAAPAEHKEKAPVAAVAALMEQMVLAPEMEAETKKVEEEFVPEDSVPVPRNARFNYCPDGGTATTLAASSSSILPAPGTMLRSTAPLGAHLASAPTPESTLSCRRSQRDPSEQRMAGRLQLQNRWMWIDVRACTTPTGTPSPPPAATPACT